MILYNETNYIRLYELTSSRTWKNSNPKPLKTTTITSTVLLHNLRSRTCNVILSRVQAIIGIDYHSATIYIHVSTPQTLTRWLISAHSEDKAFKLHPSPYLQVHKVIHTNWSTPFMIHENPKPKHDEIKATTSETTELNLNNRHFYFSSICITRVRQISP